MGTNLARVILEKKIYKVLTRLHIERPLPCSKHSGRQRGRQSGKQAVSVCVTGLDRYLLWVLLPGSYSRAPEATDGLCFGSCPVLSAHGAPLYHHQDSYYRDQRQADGTPLSPALPPVNSHTSGQTKNMSEAVAPACWVESSVVIHEDVSRLTTW